MSTKKLGYLIAACALISGCSAAIHKVNANLLVSADDLSIDQDKLQAAEVCVDKNGSACRKDFIRHVALDSMIKCNKFVDQIVLSENTVNTTGDILSTTLTALGTVFKPLTTVHALTAGSTIVSGSKSAINANIYAKASIGSFQGAIDKVYTQPMTKYLASLRDEKDDSTIDVGTEVMNVQLIHGYCTLAEAQMFVNSTVENAQPKDAPTIPVGTSTFAVPASAGTEH